MKFPSTRGAARACRWLGRGLRFFWGAIVVNLGINVASTWLTSSSTLLSNTPVGWMLAHPFPAGALALVLLALTLVIEIANHRASSTHSLSHTQTESNRRILLAILRSQYAKSQPLSGQTAISLTLRQTPDMTCSPAHLPLRHDDRSGQSPLGENTLLRFYEESGNGLLLLGEPGAGKSVLFLDLARILLERAEQDVSFPFPIVLPLSSWAVSRQPIAVWLREELHVQYHVPYSLGETWIQADHLLLLLDGLDEVAEEARSACVEAMNAYREEHFAPLLVCSRSREYLSQPMRLALPCAITIEPLTKQQVTNYLQAKGESMGEVLAALQANPVFFELTTTPLMLSIVVMAYQDEETKDFSRQGSLEELRRRIFTHYIARMLGKEQTSYSSKQILSWLSWLALQMRSHHRAVFYLERIQPDWLPNEALRQQYETGVSIVIAALFELIVAGLGGLFSTILFNAQAGFVMMSLFTMINVPMTGIMIRICNGTGHQQRRRWLQEHLQSGTPQHSRSVGKLEIQPTETLSWTHIMLRLSLRLPLKRGIVTGLVGGIIVGSFFGFFKGVGIGFLAGTTLGSYLLFVVLLATGLGLSGDMMQEHDLFTPNQGIHRSFRYGLLIGLLTGAGNGFFASCITDVFFTQIRGTPSGLLAGIILGVWVGCGSGMVSFLLNGGFACVLHLILRYFLWSIGYAPARYIHFLDYATERIFLTREGGGYRFVHPLFLDHFASLWKETTTVSQPPPGKKHSSTSE